MYETLAHKNREYIGEKARNIVKVILQALKLGFRISPYLFTTTIIVEIIRGFLPVATVWITKLIFDKLQDSLSASVSINFVQDLLPLIVMEFVILTTIGVFEHVSRYIDDKLSKEVEIGTKEEIFSKLLKFKGLYFFENPKFHNKIQLALQNSSVAPKRITTGIVELVKNVTLLASFIGILAIFSPILMMSLLVATIPAFVYEIRFAHERYSMQRALTSAYRIAAYFGYILSNVSFVKEMRLFNTGQYYLKRFSSEMRSVYNVELSQRKKELFIGFQLYAVNVATVSVASGYVIFNLIGRVISLGDMALYLQAISYTKNSLRGILSSIVTINEQYLFVEEYVSLMDLEPIISSPEDSLLCNQLKESIVFEDVWFRYTPVSEYILKGINLKIFKGEKLALVGLNGAGKTTLVKLLCRFYDPTRGNIYWDGINIKNMSPDSLRQQISAVFQDFNKYELTVKENIGLGNPIYIDNVDVMKRKISRLGILSFIDSLPEGYETVLSKSLFKEEENGTDLSGGEWQKIAIARVMLRDAHLLILDEPTASLDVVTEHEIYENFAEISQNRATLIISHRFSTVRIADRIAVLSEGVISEQGAHKDLMKLQGIYCDLYNIHSSKFTI